MEVYSIQSPLGAAILGARPGERRSYALPSGAALTVELVDAVPYGVHRADLK
jgi:transcription elongation GreA/GreB family factor